MEKKFTEDEAQGFMMKYLEENEKDFTILVSVQYVGTGVGPIETCGGCTLGDGRDCWTPNHYVDKFSVVCAKTTGNKRYNLLMGWSRGGHDCSNAYGDYNEVISIY